MAAPTPPSLILHNLTTLLLRQFPDSSPKLVGPLAVSTYTLLASSPPPSPAQIASFVELTLVPHLDPSLSDQVTSALSQKLTRFNPRAKGSELLHQALSVQFDPATADQFMANQVPHAAWHLASHATNPNLSPDKLRAFQDQAFSETLSSALPQQPPPPDVDYDSLRQVTQEAMIESPQPPENYWIRPSEPNQVNPVFRSIVDRGFSRFRYDATRVATEKFLTTKVGQTVLAQANRVLGENTVSSALGRMGVKATQTAAKTAAAGAAKATAGAVAKTAAGAAVRTAISSLAGIVNPALLIANIAQLLWSLRRQIADATRYALTFLFLLPSIIGAGIAGTLAAILAASIATPVIIALVLFIINAGAYVVPPGPEAIGGVPPGVGPIVPGPGGAYPYCWPTEGSVQQGPPPPGSTTTCRDIFGNVVSCSHVTLRSNAFDISNTSGTPIYATHDGTAIRSFDGGGYGIYVTITSSLGFTTYYAHMLANSSPLPFQVATPVTAGTRIGEIGATGNVTGPHLHYEFHGTVSSVNSCGTTHSCIVSFVPPCSMNGSCTYYSVIPPVRSTNSSPTCYARDRGGRP